MPRSIGVKLRKGDERGVGRLNSSSNANSSPVITVAQTAHGEPSPAHANVRADAVARRRFGVLAGPFHDERPVFGCVKGTFTVKKPIRSAWQTAVVGGLAAGRSGLRS